MPSRDLTSPEDVVTEREQFVRVGGLSLYVRECGAGQPLLLVNGIGAHVGMWRPLERELPGFRVISFDAPGTGRSETPLVPATFDCLAVLALGVLDQLGYERADVLGYSFGGIVAQRLARLAGDRVRRLVLAATTPGWGGVPGTLSTLMNLATPLRYYWRSHYEAVVGDLMGGRARVDPDYVRHRGDERLAHPPAALGYMWQLAALTADLGSLPWLHTLDHPTLVVAGDDDPIMPVANSLLLANCIPNARLLVAPGEGHLLVLDPESQVVPVVREFLEVEDLATSAAWRAAARVDRPMVDQAVDAAGTPSYNPIALLSATVRQFWYG